MEREQVPSCCVVKGRFPRVSMCQSRTQRAEQSGASGFHKSTPSPVTSSICRGGNTKMPRKKKSNSTGSYKWFLSLEARGLSSPVLLIPSKHQIKPFPFTESLFPGAECVTR